MPANNTLESLVHSLRNRLNNISMNAELAKLELDCAAGDRAQDSGSEAALQSIEAILVACRECGGITEDFVTLLAGSTASGKQDTDEHR